MKKLEDIPKKEIFDVPEGYFDKLPGIIQARVAREVTPRFSMARFTLRYALPAMMVVVAAVLWFMPQSSSTDPEALLAGIQTEELVAFISEGDLSTEELMDEVELNATEVEDIEDEVYGLPLDQEAAEDFIDDLEL